MRVYYFSRTGNIRRFVKKLDVTTVEATSKTVVEEPYVLIMYTTGIGEVPGAIEAFFNTAENCENLKGLICSGNKNWGVNYCKAADILSRRLNVPVLQKFELSGNVHDVNQCNTILEEIDNA